MKTKKGGVFENPRCVWEAVWDISSFQMQRQKVWHTDRMNGIGIWNLPTWIMNDWFFNFPWQNVYRYIQEPHGSYSNGALTVGYVDVFLVKKNLIPLGFSRVYCGYRERWLMAYGGNTHSLRQDSLKILEIESAFLPQTKSGEHKVGPY